MNNKGRKFNIGDKVIRINKEFYNNCANLVENYCNRNDIEVYIKNKTRSM